MEIIIINKNRKSSIIMISAYMFQHYCQMNSSDNALKDSPWHLNTPKVSFGAYS